MFIPSLLADPVTIALIVTAVAATASAGTSIASAAGAFDPAPDRSAEEAKRARRKAAEEAQRRRGRGASILTGGAGVQAPATLGQPSLLGGP